MPPRIVKHLDENAADSSCIIVSWRQLLQRANLKAKLSHLRTPSNFCDQAKQHIFFFVQQLFDSLDLKAVRPLRLTSLQVSFLFWITTINPACAPFMSSCLVGWLSTKSSWTGAYWQSMGTLSIHIAIYKLGFGALGSFLYSCSALMKPTSDIMALAPVQPWLSSFQSDKVTFTTPIILRQLSNLPGNSFYFSPSSFPRGRRMTTHMQT